MTISLSAETQRLLDERLQSGRYSSADELLRIALLNLEHRNQLDYDDLDAETRAAIEEAEAQYQRGEGRPLSEVREEILRRFGNR